LVDGVERLKRHVSALDRPLVVLFEQDRSDQAGDGGRVGEDAHHIGAPLDLAVEAFQRVGAVDLGAVVLG
jgi:hypothetical protein